MESRNDFSSDHAEITEPLEKNAKFDDSSHSLVIGPNDKGEEAKAKEGESDVGYHEMTDEEYDPYMQQLEESESESDDSLYLSLSKLMDSGNDFPTYHSEVTEPLEKKDKLDDSSHSLVIGPNDKGEEAKAKKGEYYVRYREMTDEEYDRYMQQLEKSDGFDMERFPNAIDCGMIEPVTLTPLTPCYLSLASDIGKIAVEDYNRKAEKQGGVMLEFMELMKLNWMSVAGMIYYLTFKAKDVGAPDNQSRVYQTKVYEGIKETEVELFRLKP